MEQLLELDDFDDWLHKTALALLPSWAPRQDVEDLVQEGRLAMWRSMDRFDPARGSMVSWATSAARMRMTDLAWGTGQPTGHEPVRGSRPVEEGPSLDGMEDHLAEAMLGYVSQEFHDGEILRVIREHLTPEQQQYVFLRFWGGLDPTSRAPGVRALISEFPVLSNRSHWVASRKVLRERLAEHHGPGDLPGPER